MPLLGALKNNIIISRLPNRVSDLMMLNINSARATNIFHTNIFLRFSLAQVFYFLGSHRAYYTKLDASYVARKIYKYIENFLWELSTCGRYVSGRGRTTYVYKYVCFGVAAYFCWYFKYYEYALVYLLVYVFPSESKQAKVFESFSVFRFFFENTKISNKTAGCQLWSA